MYFSAVALFALAQLTSVRAQTYGFDTLTSPNTGSSFAVGSILPIVWEPEATTGTVSIILNGGATPGTLQFVTTVATSIKSQDGSYNWTIPSNIGAFATYGLNLTHDNAPEFQYSYPFHLTGGSGTSSSSSSSSSSSASGTSSVSSQSSSTSASGSTTVSTTSSGAGTTTVIQSTPSATFPSTTSAATTLSTGFSNSTISKTSSPQSSSTSSTPASTASSTKTNGASATFVSGSLAVVAAMVFALAL